MSNKTKIEEALHDLLLKEDREFVAMISGEWGIGKTYFWNDFKDKYLQTKDVVYISLFGKNSLQDIEAEIVTKLSKYTKGLKKYTKHLDTVSNLGSKAMGLPINISMGSILSLFSPNDFKNLIICFDDFERLSEKISLKDVMGLISQFTEKDTNIIEKEIVEQYIIKHIFYEYSHMGDNPIIQILSDFDWAQKYLDQLYVPQHTISETIVTKTIETIIEKRHISKENSIILSSTSYKDDKSFIKSSTSFVELLVSFLHSYSTYPNIEIAIINIKEALISLKEASDKFAWKVENIVKSGNIILKDEK